MTTRRTHPLLELDEELGALVPKARMPAARAELHVEVHRIGAGPLTAMRSPDAHPGHVGLLLLEGVIAREVLVSDTISTELLGPGDVLRPWGLHDEPPLLQFEVRWTALTESSVAVLDRRFGARLTHWPEVNAVLIDRLNDRAKRLAVTQAISQLNRVDRRVLALFWHLAERWGRMTPDGVLVPLTLSHRMLGQLVGARRPTVSSAVAKLADSEELVRRDNGTWLLKGDPIGVPSGAAQRVVPIRRRLLGAEAGAPAVAAAAAEEAAAQIEDAVLTSGAGAELRATLERLRSDSQQYLADLVETSRRANELLRRSRRGAEERREARAARAGSG